ncbi:MAG: family transporter, partial [Acidobacteria bacterium]|nr:family transporter [Acidobacteriota bacterium]
MTPTENEFGRFRRWTMLLYVVGITALFAAMIRGYLVALIMAAVLAAVSMPVYGRLARWLGRRKSVAAALTVVFMLLVVVIPLLVLLGMIVAQGTQVAANVTPWIQRLIRDPGPTEQELIRTLGLPERWGPYIHQMLTRVGQVSDQVGRFAFESLTGAAASAAGFLLQVFVALYA